MFKTFRPFEVPHTFKFVDPDTGFQFEESNRKLLIKRIIDYRAQNRLDPIEHLHLVLDNYWCELPENEGKCTPLKLKRGFMPMLKGAVFVIKNIFYGQDNLTDRDTAVVRANICIKCPHNINPDKLEPNEFNKWADNVALHSTDGAYLQIPFSVRNKLYNCEICTCPLKAKVWYKGKATLPKEEQEKLPDFCWQKDLKKD